MENEPAYLLKMTRQTKHADRNEGANGVKDVGQEYVGAGEDYSMTFEFKDVIDFAVEGAALAIQAKLQNGNIFYLNLT